MRGPLKPVEQLDTGNGTICHGIDRDKPGEQALGSLQQHDYHLVADTGIWMLKCLPRRRNCSAMADHGEHQDLSNCFLDEQTIGTKNVPPSQLRMFSMTVNESLKTSLSLA